MANILRKQLTADEHHMLHIELPYDMEKDVDVIILPRSSSSSIKTQDGLIDDSGFIKNILNSAEEDCWNEL